MKRLVVYMAIILGGMMLMFSVGRHVNADHNGNKVVVDTASMVKILNDTKEAVRINDVLVNPNTAWSGGGIVITIFVPSVSGSGTYKLSGNVTGADLRLSVIMQSIGSGKVDAFDIHTGLGNINGIVVEYEALTYGAD